MHKKRNDLWKIPISTFLDQKSWKIPWSRNELMQGESWQEIWIQGYPNNNIWREKVTHIMSEENRDRLNTILNGKSTIDLQTVCFGSAQAKNSIVQFRLMLLYFWLSEFLRILGQEWWNGIVSKLSVTFLSHPTYGNGYTASNGGVQCDFIFSLLLLCSIYHQIHCISQQALTEQFLEQCWRSCQCKVIPK